ncbi:TetR/AcrR family transcriptional regulator [Amycolatopsis pigmentata]|uniref:TetR/AcrR family transcriptional regulator n=1 Tax=Amycolatopsis pigmentata TaxID=450801 RepID=A0ABW5G3A7_9PSEU
MTPPENGSERLWDDDLADVAKALLSSAVQCFADKGFHGTTTRDITTTVGLTPGALYVHFSSKEEVLFELVRSAHARVLDELRSAPPTGNADAHLRWLVARFVTWHATHHTVGRVCQYELAPLTAEHYARVLEQRGQINTVFREAVRRRVDRRHFTEQDINRVARAILSLGVDLVRWYRLGGPDSPTWLGEFYADLAIRMTESPRAEADH